MADLLRGYSDDIKALYAAPKLGVAEEDILWTILDKVGDSFNTPLRLFASSPANTLLNIDSNQVVLGDGAALSTQPSEGTLPRYPITTIDFMTGEVVGGSVLVKTLVGTDVFSLPASTPGNYIRAFFVFQTLINSVVCAFSTESATIEGLQNPGALTENLEGQAFGYGDLQAVGTGSQYKTAGSTSNIIENSVNGTPRIYRFKSADGTAGAPPVPPEIEDTSFKINRVTSTNTIYIFGGQIHLSDGKTIATYTGTDNQESSFGVDINFDLSSIFPSPLDDTTYYLYVDKSTLTPTLTEVGRLLYGVVGDNFYLSTLSPEDIDRTLYATVGTIRREGGFWVDPSVTSSPTKKLVGFPEGDTSTKLSTIEDNNLLIFRGLLQAEDGKMLYLATDLYYDLTGILADGYYYFYVDLNLIGAPSYYLDLEVYEINESHIVCATVSPDVYGESRYLWIGSSRKAGAAWDLLVSRPLRANIPTPDVDARIEASLPLQQIGTVGEVGQIAAGHKLGRSSFRDALTEQQLSFWNLDTGLDGFGGRDFFSINVPFTGTDIFGSNSCALFTSSGTKYLSSTSSVFEADGTDFCLGGWFYLTLGMDSPLFTQGNIGFESYNVYLSSNQFYMSGLTAGGIETSTALATLISTRWMYVAMRYVASSHTMELYLSGVKVGEQVLSSELLPSPDTPNLIIGDQQNPNRYAGMACNFFFIKAATTSDEVLKIYCSKFNHDRDIAYDSQRWFAWYRYNGICKAVPSEALITHIEPNDVFFNVSSPSTAYISMKLYNGGIQANSKVEQPKTLELTVAQLDEALPIQHGMKVPPELSFEILDDLGEYNYVNHAAYFTADENEIKLAKVEIPYELPLDPPPMDKLVSGGSVISGTCDRGFSFVLNESAVVSVISARYNSPGGYVFATISPFRDSSTPQYTTIIRSTNNGTEYKDMILHPPLFLSAGTHFIYGVNGDISPYYDVGSGAPYYEAVGFPGGPYAQAKALADIYGYFLPEVTTTAAHGNNGVDTHDAKGFSFTLTRDTAIHKIDVIGTIPDVGRTIFDMEFYLTYNDMANRTNLIRTTTAWCAPWKLTNPPAPLFCSLVAQHPITLRAGTYWFRGSPSSLASISFSYDHATAESSVWNGSSQVQGIAYFKIYENKFNQGNPGDDPYGVVCSSHTDDSNELEFTEGGFFMKVDTAFVLTKINLKYKLLELPYNRYYCHARSTRHFPSFSFSLVTLEVHPEYRYGDILLDTPIFLPAGTYFIAIEMNASPNTSTYVTIPFKYDPNYKYMGVSKNADNYATPIVEGQALHTAYGYKVHSDNIVYRGPMEDLDSAGIVSFSFSITKTVNVVNIAIIGQTITNLVAFSMNFYDNFNTLRDNTPFASSTSMYFSGAPFHRYAANPSNVGSYEGSMRLTRELPPGRYWVRLVYGNISLKYKTTDVDEFIWDGVSADPTPGAVAMTMWERTDGFDMMGESRTTEYESLYSTLNQSYETLDPNTKTRLSYCAGTLAHVTPNTSWNTYTKTSNFSFNINDRVLVDLRFLAITGLTTVTGLLPPNPKPYDEVEVVDARNVFGSGGKTFIFLRNEKLINGSASDYPCSTPGKKYSAVYVNDNYGWLIN